MNKVHLEALFVCNAGSKGQTSAACLNLNILGGSACQTSVAYLGLFVLEGCVCCVREARPFHGVFLRTRLSFVQRSASPNMP